MVHTIILVSCVAPPVSFSESGRTPNITYDIQQSSVFYFLVGECVSQNHFFFKEINTGFVRLTNQSQTVFSHGLCYQQFT